MPRAPAVAALVMLLAWPSAAQQRSEFPVKIHGFLIGNLAVRSSGQRPPGGEGGAFVLGEERLRFDVSAASKSGEASVLVKGDVFHDAVANRAASDLREGYVAYHRGPFDLRVGRQVLTWGVGDLFFINDVFPKDWQSFFSGRPMEYLKRGIDAFRAQYSSAVLNIDLVATPFFRPDVLPSPKRFFLYNPLAGAASEQEIIPPARAENTELALRLYRRVARFDVSLYGYRGFWRTPAVAAVAGGDTLRATRFYPRLVVWGASAQRNWLHGVVSLEGGHYGSPGDRSGADPAIPNSEWRFLAAYQSQIGRELTAQLQGYAEIMEHHPLYRRFLPAGAPLRDQARAVFSVRLTQFWGYQSWKLSVFLAHSPTDSDYFLQPEVSHRLTDRLSVAMGANLFGGRRDSTFFGQMKKDDNVYASARFDF